MKTQIIQLDEHDDILSAKDKIGWSQANRVLLIWPEEGSILTRRIDLVLLHRHVRGLGGRIALITRSRQAKIYARQLGIPVFRSTKAAQRSAWRSVPHKSISEAAPNQRREALYRLRGQVLAQRPRLPSKILPRLIPFFSGMFAFLALVLFFLPSATITLAPAEQPQEVTLDIWANSSILSPNPSGSIPARIVTAEVEGRQQAASTSWASLPSAAAAGSVRFTNLTAAEVSIPAGTIVSTLAAPAVRFETGVRAAVPAGVGQAVDVPVRAVLAGSRGNVSAGQIHAIEGSLGLRLTVDNPEPAAGGADQTSQAPSEADYRQLRESLSKQLQQDALAQMQVELEPGFRLLREGLRQNSVLLEAHQPEAGQPGERAQLQLRVEYAALAVSEPDLRQVAETVLNAGLPSGYLSVPGSLELQDQSAPRPDGERIHWRVTASRRIYRPLNSKSIARQVAGRSSAQASQLLQQDGSLQSAPQIRVAPAWWNRLPFLSLRIQVIES